MPPPYTIVWLQEAEADVRAIDRVTAMQIFSGILRFARTGEGDVVALHGSLSGWLRLRVGDFRVLFRLENNCMRISGVRHRSDVYR